MIKASSLFYAIVISLLIAIVSSSLILFAYLSTIQFDNFEMSQRLKLNVDSGISLLLSKQSIVEPNQQKTVDLYGTKEDEVFLSRKTWGAYELIISKAVFKNQQEIKIAQIGYFSDTIKKYSLYLADEDKPLAVCGKNIIKGTAYLPKAGIKRAYIEGQNFVGNNMVDGQIKESEKQLPKFNEALINIIEGYLSKKEFSENDSIVEIANELSGDSIKNSFLNKTIVFETDALLSILNGFYAGNIIISSSKQITVSSDAFLDNVILVAPKIIFEKHVNGVVQAFASDSIIVKENVTLLYPSCLAVIKTTDVIPVSAIVLNENDSISGAVFCFKKTQNPLKQVGVILKKNTFVYGQVFTSGYVDMQGVVVGSVMCNKILLTTPASVYENHLLNAEIDNTKLSKYFVGINLVEESEFKKVVKWLD